MRIPFHQYQRYKMTQIVIDSIRKKNQKFKILEVGANQHKNLEKFLAGDDIFYLDIIVPENLKADQRYIEGDATDMHFGDSSFDLVIALDVLEHIPSDKRESFFEEINRVSKHGFFISAPFEDYEIEGSEERISKYFKALYNTDIIWSKEHKENGLPSLAMYTKFIVEELKLNYFVIQHGSINLWEKFMRMELTTGLNNKLVNYWNTINDYYNKEIFLRDFTEKCIRTFIFSSKDNIYIEKVKQAIFQKKEELTTEYMEKIIDLEESFYNLASSLASYEDPSQIVDKYFLQLFIDAGQGYSEKQSLSTEFKLNKNKNIIKFEFNLDSFDIINAIRIDPLNDSCIVVVKHVDITDSSSRILTIKDMKSNAEFNIGQEYVFLNEDPQLIIENTKQIKVARISIELQYINWTLNIGREIINNIKDTNAIIEHLQNRSKINDEKIGAYEERLKTFNEVNKEQEHCVKQLNEEKQQWNEKIKNLDEKNKKQDDKIKQLEVEIIQREKQIRTLEHHLSLKDEEIILLHKKILTYENSLTWRLTKPIRKVLALKSSNK